jgi:glutathione synthase/RimK-type ligase-like ATP-grasp enzyme
VAPKLITTNLIVQACEELNIKFSYVTKNKTVLAIHLANKDHYIINSNLGLISNTQADLCKDKGYQNELLCNVVSMPTTISYLDPHSKYKEFAIFKSHQEISNDIEKNFSFPTIIKKNTGIEGENVYLCNDKEEITKAVKTIFNKQDRLYDHVLIAQKHIKIKNEFRAIFYKHKLKLLYKKDINQATFIGNLSPLHYKGAKAIEINDINFQEEINQFIAPIFSKLDLTYAGFDIAKDEEGKLWLIEINSVPGYAHYLENNEDDKLTTLFKQILSDLNK